MRLLSLINEIVSGGEIYHYTYPNSISSILKSNSINLSSNLGGAADKFGNKLFFLSLSRTKSLRQGYKAGVDREMTRIVFDSNKLNTRFKSMPVDYWGLKGTREANRSNNSSFEFEDRLVSDKPIMDNVINYIIRIEGVVKPDGSNMAKTTADLISTANSLNVPIQIYANEKDLYLKRNSINDSFTEGIERDPEYKPWTYSYGGRILEHILAINLYSESYFNNPGGMDQLCADMETYKKNNGIELEMGCFDLYEKMKNLYFNNMDSLRSFKADLHNLFKSGTGSKQETDVRKHIMLLTREMKKYGVTSVDDYYKIKIHGIKPAGSRIDYSKSYALYEMLGEEWVMTDNSKSLEKLPRIYFNTGRYGGYVSDDDMDAFFKIRGEDGTVGQWINYLMNKYTLDKVKEIVHNSGFDSYYKTFNWKIDKI